MAVTHQQQPQEDQINGADQPSIASRKPAPASTSMAAENPVPKRQRRPSVRLGEIGDQPAAALTKPGKAPSKASRTRPLTNLNAGEERENVDNLAIGSWKVKGSKSKRPRTNWASKIDDGVGTNLDGQDGFIRDSENEQSLDNSFENERNLNFKVGDDDEIELDGPSDDGGGQSVRRWGRDDGVKVWLNGLGLGRYWPIFQIHEVDEEILPFLTLEDLKDMGINAVGSRRKMYCAIQKLNEVFS